MTVFICIKILIHDSGIKRCRGRIYYVHSIYVTFMIGTCRSHRVNKEAYNLVHFLVNLYIFDNARYKYKKSSTEHLSIMQHCPDGV
jgi:hypothetical protein